MDEYTRSLVRSADRPEGVLWQSPDRRATIWVKTWSQILTEARARLRVCQKELNYSADRDASVALLQESYARILSGAPAPAAQDEEPEESADADEGDEASTPPPAP